jgi:hypothetical protein
VKQESILDSKAERSTYRYKLNVRKLLGGIYWKNGSLWVRPPIIAIFSVVIVLDERTSKHLLFLLARHFSPRYEVLKFRRMPNGDWRKLHFTGTSPIFAVCFVNLCDDSPWQEEFKTNSIFVQTKLFLEK